MVVVATVQARKKRRGLWRLELAAVQRGAREGEVGRQDGGGDGLAVLLVIERGWPAVAVAFRVVWGALFVVGPAVDALKGIMGAW